MFASQEMAAEEDAHQKFLVNNFQGDTKYYLNNLNSIFFSTFFTIQRMERYTIFCKGTQQRKVLNVDVLNRHVQLVTASVFEMGKYVGTSVSVQIARTRILAKTLIYD